VERSSNYQSALDQRLCDLDDRDLLGLLSELNHVTGLDYRDSAGLMLLPYLVLCVFRGGKKRIPLDSKCAAPGLLTTRLERLSSESIRMLCRDLADRTHEGIETHEGKTLLSYLNFILRKLTTPRKKRQR
jgi:hypothetical protein